MGYAVSLDLRLQATAAVRAFVHEGAAGEGGGGVVEGVAENAEPHSPEATLKLKQDPYQKHKARQETGVVLLKEERGEQ